MILSDLNIGDAVEYKQQGRFGCYEAIVTGIGMTKVGIKIESHLGIPLPAGPVFKNVSPRSLRKPYKEIN